MDILKQMTDLKRYNEVSKNSSENKDSIQLCLLQELAIGEADSKVNDWKSMEDLRELLDK